MTAPRTWLLALIASLCWTWARASWQPLFAPQALCAANCQGRWSRPQLSLDGASVVVAQTQGQTTSLWKFAVNQPRKRVLVYRGAVRLWALDAAPSLVVLKPDNTLLSYDLTQKKQRWSVKILDDVASINLLIPGQVLILKTAYQLSSLRLLSSASGQMLELMPGFELRPASRGGNEPLPVTRSEVREVVYASIPGAEVAFRITNTASGATWLEGYGSFYDCVACGSSK
ncbi:hypothetical protein [Deinococcus sp.]|uniref:hypothetical protein n=1 Tax=Deinococcus sp. TaxID=47478 RepID=UPI003CC5D3FE